MNLFLPPSLSPECARLLHLLKNSDLSARDLAERVHLARSVMDRIFLLAEAGGFAARRPVHSVEVAIRFLGLEKFAFLGLIVHAHDVLTPCANEAAFDTDGFWRHAVDVGLVSRAFAAEVGIPEGPAFLTGFLHDVGKIVLGMRYPEAYPAVCRRAAAGEHPVDVEAELLGMDHSRVGAGLLGEWKLGVDLQDGVGYHHRPGDEPGTPCLASVVHAADALCHSIREGFPESDPGYRIHGAVARRFDLCPSRIGEWMARAAGRLRQTGAFLEALKGVDKGGMK